MLYADLEPDPTALSAQHLERIAEPVFEVVEARLERGYDNAFDHFLWDNIGDPVAARDEQGGVTDAGYMLHLRRLPGVAVQSWTLTDIRDNPPAYEIALGNTHDNNGNYDGQWRSVFVQRADRVASSERLPGHAMTTVYFTEDPLETVPARIIEPNPRNMTIANHLAERALCKEIEDWWSNKPRVVLSSHIRRLYLPQMPYERLHLWADVVEQLNTYGQRIAQMLLAESVDLNLVRAS